MPLRKSLIPSYITLDTSCLIDLLCSCNIDMLNNVTLYKDVIWEKFFKINNNVFHKKKYIFDYMIKTDGVAVSILFIKVDANNIPIKPTIKKIIEIENLREKINDCYIENQENVKEILENKNYVVIDPNKEDLIYCMDKNENFFKYTQSQRKFESKSKRYSTFLENKKKTTNIIYNEDIYNIKEMEANLSKYNSKTSNYNKFKEYILMKDFYNEILHENYKKNIYRKIKMNVYINKNRSESNMINNFKNKFGDPENTIVILGDYDDKGNHLKYKEATIIKHQRYLFRRAKYKLYMINEYHTSKLCNHCESEVIKNYYIRPKENKTVWGLVCCKNKKCVQAIQTNKNEDGSFKYDKRIMNRDTNAVLNMKKIVENLILTNKRPIKYEKPIMFHNR